MSPASTDFNALGISLVQLAQVVLWTAIAAGLLVGAMKVFDLLTPGKLHEQVFSEKNVAAAIVYGAALIGFAIVISAAMH